MNRHPLLIRAIARFRNRVVPVFAALVLAHGLAFAQSPEPAKIATFRLGLLARAIADLPGTALSDIKRAYSMALGLPVDLYLAPDYAALIDAQASGRVHYAIYSATAFATAWRLCGCVDPVAAPKRQDGATGIRAVLIARSGMFGSLADAGGHRIAAVDGAVAGVELTRPALAGLGSEPQWVSVDTASAAEAMFVAGSVDGILGWAPATSDAAQIIAGGTVARLAEAGVVPASMAVVWSSDLVRFGPHALRTGLDPQVKKSLTIFLTAMHSQSPNLYDLLDTYHGGGFDAVTPEDYGPVLGLVASPPADDSKD